MVNSNNSPVLVAGATGFLGGEICRQLVAENFMVRALVRSSSDSLKVEKLKGQGIEIVQGDLKDRASLERALRGVSAVISTVSCTFSRQDGDSIHSVDDEGQANLIRATINAGVSRFIYISFSHMAIHFPLQEAKRKAERLLMESDLQYTILQPTFFMESWLSPALGFDYNNAKATIYGDGKNKISWISVKDVAAFAVASLQNDATIRKSFELGGPEALSPLEVVEIFETANGRKFALDFVPEEALLAQKSAAPDPLSESFASLMLSFARGSEINMQEPKSVFNLEQESVQEYACMDV
jgi:uncharacterized protein YbjT (DUF2867 family)